MAITKASKYHWPKLNVSKLSHPSRNTLGPSFTFHGDGDGDGDGDRDGIVVSGSANELSCTTTFFHGFAEGASLLQALPQDDEVVDDDVVLLFTTVAP
ncbi:hypothetical protein L1987_30470 [Smallanthus sonchifolius]|uniref:Uncharacterized protein n=1 Tax=Smallanthus sonchifolius TaxID=185202 RepID=A0ACB9I2X6_9ASTR|nr:hypothetical protein L1987_30470 [Smallanthus sonchifolius]